MTHWWINVTFLACVYCLLTIPCTGQTSLKEDIPFPTLMLVKDRNITCEQGQRSVFVAPTWTCTNIKVSGVRISYGYPPKLRSDKMCGDGSGLNNIAGLCRVLLHTIGLSHQVWTAFVSDAVCTNQTQERVEFRAEGSLGSDELLKTAHWHDIPRTRLGYIKTLQCMVFT